MKKATPNPRGLPTRGQEAEAPVVVRVGPHGKLTHILGPKGACLCRSGKHAGRYAKGATEEERRAALELRQQQSPQLIFQSEGTKVTCYRCIKLAQLNLARSKGRSFLP